MNDNKAFRLVVMVDCPDYGATCLFGADNCVVYFGVVLLISFCMNPFLPCGDENTMDVHVRRLIGVWGVRTVIKYILIEGDKRACTFH